MSVTFDAIGGGVDTGTPATSPLDIGAPITVGSGTNRALVLQVAYRAVVTGIGAIWDFGGTAQAMTLIGSAASASTQFVALFGLVAPTSGAKTLRLTFTGAAGDINLQCVSWTGVDQTGGSTSFPNFNSGIGSSSGATVTITSATGNATMSVIGGGTAQVLNSVSATQSFLIHGTGALESGGSYAAGSASNVMTGTFAGSEQWVAIGTDILASGGGAPTVALEWKQPTSQPTDHYRADVIMVRSQSPQAIPWLPTLPTFVTNTYDWILPTIDIDWTVG